MNIFEMKQNRATLTASIRELMDKYDGVEMVADDKETLAKLEAEFDALNERIVAEEKQLERERLMGEVEPENPASVNNLFAKALSGNAEYMRNFQNSMNLGTDSQAGYLTAPVEFRQELIKGLDDVLFMRQISKVIGGIGAAQSLGFPYRTTAAVVPSWTGEVDDAPEETTVAYGRREFKPYRIADLIKISRTLMNHAPMAEGVLKDEIVSRLAAAQEKAYLTGDGVAKPLGIFTASNDGIPTSRDVATDNTTTTVTFDGLLNAKYSVKAQYQTKAQWVCHRDLCKMLAKIKDGDGQYVWMPSVRDGQPDILLGKPVNMSEYAPNTFTTGLYAAVYGDFSFYWICDADAMTVQVLDQPYATKNQIGYIWDYFGDGMPVIGEAFARVKLG
jgi:HK97 family phage major capsid protein